jgi:hypothetical protein
MPHTVHFLRWSDVDPSARAFDPAPARAAVADRLRLAVGTPKPEHGDDALEDSVDRAIVAVCGAWAAGWRWAASEPGGGGPVRGWCCARDSLFVGDDEEALGTIDRVVAALAEWRAFLEEIASAFAVLRASSTGQAVEERVEHAAAHLLPTILRHTRHEDAWYSTFVSVLSWYLEAEGYAPELVDPVVARVVSARFESWIAPRPSVAREACAELGHEVALALADPPHAEDALAAWRSRRGGAFPWPPSPRDREPVRGDAHLRYIEGPERARDPDRAARMAAALDACRASAHRGERLTFERLAAWQAIVLGRPAPFRAGDAYAKGGRERYALLPETPQHFDAALDEAGDLAANVAVRAARAFLDVCFFHPFDDGNARAARLALEHVITRAGLALHAVEPLFVVARSARSSPDSLAWSVEYLLGPRSP